MNYSPAKVERHIPRFIGAVKSEVPRVLLAALTISVSSAFLAPPTLAQELSHQPVNQPLFKGESSKITVLCLGENRPTTIYFDQDYILFDGIAAGPSDANFGIVMGNPQLGHSILIDAGHDREVGTEIIVDGDINSNLREGVEIQTFPLGAGGFYMAGRIASHTRIDSAYITLRDAQRVVPSACQEVRTWAPGNIY